MMDVWEVVVKGGVVLAKDSDGRKHRLSDLKNDGCLVGYIFMDGTLSYDMSKGYEYYLQSVIVERKVKGKNARRRRGQH